MRQGSTNLKLFTKVSFRKSVLIFFEAYSISQSFSLYKIMWPAAINHIMFIPILLAGFGKIAFTIFNDKECNQLYLYTTGLGSVLGRSLMYSFQKIFTTFRVSLLICMVLILNLNHYINLGDLCNVMIYQRRKHFGQSPSNAKFP